MIKIYMRLLGFAKPIGRYAVPYFFYAALHAIFNTFNYAMIIPILNAMFSEGFVFKPVDCDELAEQSVPLLEWLHRRVDACQHHSADA